MKIEHLQLQWDDLPRTEDIVLQPVDKNYLKIIYIEWAIIYGAILVLGAALLYFIKALQTPFWIAGTAAIYIMAVLLSFWMAKKAFVFKAYAFRERDVITRNGWLFQELQVVPINKIQHCVVKTGPLEKKFQLASLKLFTAGKDSDLTLSGLKAEQAGQLKEWIVSKQHDHA